MPRTKRRQNRQSGGVAPNFDYQPVSADALQEEVNYYVEKTGPHGHPQKWQAKYLGRDGLDRYIFRILVEVPGAYRKDTEVALPDGMVGPNRLFRVYTKQEGGKRRLRKRHTRRR